MLARLVGHARHNAVAYLALFVALGGTSAYAANEWNSSNIQDETLTGADIRGKNPTPTVAGVNGTRSTRRRRQPGSRRSADTVNQPYVNGSLSGWDIADNSLQRPRSPSRA